MNKAQLIEVVMEKARLSKPDASNAIEAVFGGITEALCADDSVIIVGFGSFTPKKKAAKLGRNPRTGEPLQIAAKTVASFSASKALKDAIQSQSKDKKEKAA